VRFDEAWPLAAEVPGWLTRDQGRVLWASCAEAGREPSVLEVGSHEGRSTVLLALAVQELGGHLTAVDPFDPRWRYGTPGTEERLRERLRRTGAGDRVDVRVARSADLRRAWSRPLALVYVDGGHDYPTARDDLAWADHLPAGGRLLMHDAFSSVGVTLALLLHVLPGRRLAYERRTGSLAVLVRRRPSLRDRVRILTALPWFARNIVVKVLLRARLRGPARLLGHDEPNDPY
jgi:predicted O-methyltransferase YrrM